MPISDSELDQFELDARRDDLFDVIVPSDVRRLIAEIRRLRSPHTGQPDDRTGLKTCPFCGVIPTLEKTIDGRKWWGVVCRSAKNRGGTCAISSRPTASPEAAIERWNNRAPMREYSNQPGIPDSWHLGEAPKEIGVQYLFACKDIWVCPAEWTGDEWHIHNITIFPDTDFLKDKPTHWMYLPYPADNCRRG